MSPRSTAEKEERKLTLPVGHPEAGYVSPDRSLQDGVGTLPDEEQQAFDDQIDARDADVEAVADHEHEIAIKAAKAAEEAEKAAAKSETKASSPEAPKS